MRKLLILSVLALLTASATGCATRCGESWRPGYYLFGAGRQNQNQYQQHGYECCDPCMSGSGFSAPVMTSAPCCQ